MSLSLVIFLVPKSALSDINIANTLSCLPYFFPSLKKTFYFEILLDLQKSYNNRDSPLIFRQISPDVSIFYNYDLMMKVEKLMYNSIIGTIVLTNLQTLFGFYQVFTNVLFLFQDPLQVST